MAWLYGFWCKYRYAKRIGRGLGYSIDSLRPLKLILIAERHMKRTTGAYFIMDTDYRQRVIVAFAETKRRETCPASS